MNITINSTFLPHNDPDESLDFYRDKLGFEVRKDVRYNGLSWITVGPPNQPEMSIVLTPPAADPGITEEESAMIAEMMAKGTFGHIIFETDNLEAVFDEIQGKGAEVVHEPTDQPYGVRDCAFRDPAGNLVRINQAA